MTRHDIQEDWDDVKLLWNQFDPIGVYGPDSEWADDEYDSYVNPTIHLLRQGVDFNKLKDYISYIVYEYMGIELDESYIDDFIKKLLELRDFRGQVRC